MEPFYLLSIPSLSWARYHPHDEGGKVVVDPSLRRVAFHRGLFVAARNRHTMVARHLPRKDDQVRRAGGGEGGQGGAGGKKASL
jgi:hypothetical protein